VKLTIEKSTHDKLRYAQTLLSHAVQSRDVAEIINRALDALIIRLEKDKLGACVRQPTVAPTTSKRHIPAHVRRAVWRRDQAQCTFVSSDGHRCAARHLLEFDHVVPVAKGGRATPDGIRLRCRAHNQYEAERVFGAEFMARKRGEAQRQR